MIGMSIYLSDPAEKREKYIKQMKEAGSDSIFTSLHIPEENPREYKRSLQQLAGFAKANDLELTADISPASLEFLGHTWEKAADQLLEWGVTGLRMDYGIEAAEIAALSKKMKVALNASTLTSENLSEMVEAGLETSAIEAWHNFYPRPETGLDKEEFRLKNRWLKGKGIKVMAFIPGDGTLRGPLFKGLPTLEDHRDLSPFSAYIDLILKEGVDKVFAGDPELSQESFHQFECFQEGYFLLRARPISSQKDVLEIFKKIQTNRPDSARDCIRSMESRTEGLSSSISLEPALTGERKKGAITMDNALYGRYQGEIQITKTDLAADEKVNVIGRVIEEDLPLLSFITGGKRFRVEWIS